MRRIIDVTLAGAGLLLLCPLFLVVAGAVRWSVGSPALFRQVRTGRGGRLFTLFKLRTMRSADGPDGRPLPDADRLSRLGEWLRRTSLDELPQLWNVFRGDMSLVGPRPLLPEYLPLYSREQARRHEVKPGLTGWAQVNGRNALSWEEKFRLDVWYVDHQSLWLDLRVLAMTVKKVAAGDGVKQTGHATAEPFRGSTDLQRGAAQPGMQPASPSVSAGDDEEFEYVV